MKNILNKKQTYDKGIFLWGLLAPIPIAKIFGLAISNIVMIYLVVIGIKSFRLRKKGLVVVFLWIVALTTGLIYNYPNLNDMYRSNTASMTIKLIYVMLVVIVCINREKNALQYYLKGILYCAILQAIWMIIDLIFWYLFSISINQKVFGDLFHINISEEWITIKDGLYRPTGLGWDSAPLGLLFLVAFFYTKKRWEKVFFAICIVLSTSRHALISLIIILVFDVVGNVLKKKRTNSKKMLVFGIASLVIIGIGSFLFMRKSTMILGILNRLISVISQKTRDGSSIRHISYYYEMIKIITDSSLLNLLFGWGTLSAGYLFTLKFGYYSYLSFPWTPESEFVSLVIGSGIIVSILYYYIIFMDLRKSKNNPDVLYIVYSILLCGFMYVFIRNVWTFAIVLLLYFGNNSYNVMGNKCKTYKIGDTF